MKTPVYSGLGAGQECREVEFEMDVLSFEGLCLRPLEDRDAPAFAQAARESWATVGPWLPWCHADYTEEEALAWFASCRASREKRTEFEFGIFAEDGEEFLGGAGLNQIDVQNNLCNLGYWVRQSRQRQAIVTRSIRALTDYGFKTLGFRRIEIVVAAGNPASAGAARKAGALFEGIARNRLVIGGVSVDASVFSFVPPSNGD